MGESAALVADALGESETPTQSPAAGDSAPAAAVPERVGIVVRVAPDSPAARRGRSVTQVVDVAVSRAKFDREIDGFRRHEDQYRSRGWILDRVEFPSVTLLLGVPHIRPFALLFGVVVDFTNYDVEPPSVRLIDPFSRRPLSATDLPTNLPRRIIRTANDAPVPAQVAASIPLRIEYAGLLQALGPGAPFLCIPGTREYHEHPGHTGNPWLLHRRTGAGSLTRILEVFHTFGVAPVRGYHIVLQIGDQLQGIALPQIQLWVPEAPT